MLQDRCEAMNNRRLRCSRSQVSLSMLFSPPIRKWSIYRNTTLRWFTLRQVRPQLWRHRSSLLESVSGSMLWSRPTSPGGGVAGDGEVAASTTIAARGAAFGWVAIVRPLSGTARGLCIMQATRDMAGTGAIAPPTTGHRTPPTDLFIARPEIIRQIRAIDRL